MPKTRSHTRRYGLFILDALLLIAIVHWLHSSAIHLLDAPLPSSVLQAKASTPDSQPSAPGKTAKDLLGIDVSHYQGKCGLGRGFRELSLCFC